MWTTFWGSDMPPHGHCYLWNDQLVHLHVISDALITLSYMTIPIALVYLVWKRDDLKFNYMFIMFAVFIFACGATHLINIYNVWNGAYWLSGAVKAITAFASVGTAILVWPLVPKALALPSNAQLIAVNERLQQEMDENARRQAEVERLSADLKEQVDQRTNELAEARVTKNLLERSHASLESSHSALEEFARVSSDQYGAAVKPLLSASSRLQSTLRDGDLAAAQEAAAAIRHAAEDLQATHAALEQYTSETRLLPPEPVNTDACLDRVLSEMASTINDAGAVVEREHLPDVMMPAAHLTSLFRELLDNALNFRGDQPLRLTIQAKALDGQRQVEFTFADNGRGMSPRQRGDVGKLLYHSNSQGPGIGFSICKRIAELNGGDISIIGGDDGGTIVKVTLPAA